MVVVDVSGADLLRLGRLTDDRIGQVIIPHANKDLLAVANEPAEKRMRKERMRGGERKTNEIKSWEKDILRFQFSMPLSKAASHSSFAIFLTS